MNASPATRQRIHRHRTDFANRRKCAKLADLFRRNGASTTIVLSRTLEKETQCSIDAWDSFLRLMEREGFIERENVGSHRYSLLKVAEIPKQIQDLTISPKIQRRQAAVQMRLDALFPRTPTPAPEAPEDTQTVEVKVIDETDADKVIEALRMAVDAARDAGYMVEIQVTTMPRVIAF